MNENQDYSLYKKSLRTDNMKIVLMLIAFYIAMSTISTVLLLFPVFLSKEFMHSVIESTNGVSTSDVTTTVSLLIDSDGVRNFLPIATIISEAASLLLFLVIRGKKLFTTDIFENRDKMKIAEFVKVFFIALSAQFVFSVLALILDALLSKIGLSATEALSSAMESMMSFPGLLYVLLFGPIMEEIVFRAAIMKQLEKYGANFAIVMSAMLFACYHIYFVQVVFAFPVGILLGYIAHRYSVKWSILMHILYNSAAMLISVVAPNDYAQWIMFLAFFVLAVVLVVLNRQTIKAQIASGKPTQAGVFRITFSGVSVIVLLSCVVIMSVSTILLL